MLEVINGEFLPNKVVILKDVNNSDEIEEIAPYLKDYQIIDGKATAYVCQDFTCETPTTNPEKLKAILKK